MKGTTALVLLSTVCLTLPAAASAQSRAGALGYGSFGSALFDSRESFETVAGVSRAIGLGGGLVVTRIWHDLFADVSYGQLELDGDRVFIDDEGTVHRLRIPVHIRMRPLDIAAGWRFTRKRLSPYAGAGVSLIEYEETAGFAEPGDDVRERRPGPVVLGGVDVAVLRWLHVGGEMRYRAVTGVLGEGGVSETYREDKLGGFAAALRISVGK